MLFTGIVQGQAKVERILDSAKGSEFRTVTLGFPTPQTSASVGASVAVNGTCLTIVSIEDGGRALTFDIIDETLRRTNLGDLVEGSAVNYERAARYGDEIGGHCVSGHVHAKAFVRAIDRTEDGMNVSYAIGVPSSWAKYILPKGYIAVDGISLTVGEVEESEEGKETVFYVHLIPETLRVTVLGAKGVGSSVNIEVDTQTQAIVDTVDRYMAANRSRKHVPA